jgi:hypothetical protein
MFVAGIFTALKKCHFWKKTFLAL